MPLLSCALPSGVSGLLTAAPPGESAMRSRAPAIAFLTAVSEAVPPFSCQTTRPLFPAALFEACWSRAVALAESVSCEVGLSPKALPAAPTPAPRASNRPTQARTTASRCRWHQRARADIDEPFQEVQ